MEVDLPHRICNRLDDRYCDGHKTTFLNSRRPIITRVCRESRAIALEGTGSVTEGYARGYKYDFAENRINGWVSEATDIVHLNWTEGWEPLEARWYTESPIPFFAWLAPQFVAASILDEIVHPFGSRLRTDDNKSDYISNLEEDGYGPPLPILDELPLCKDYFVVIERVKLHLTFEKILESGLFGRLGEECIQLVDPFDQDKIYKYFELWQFGLRSTRGPRACKIL